MAPGDGEAVDLRARAGVPVPGPERDAVVARAVRTAGAGCSVKEVVEFTLDGKVVAANEGELIVHAAVRHGTFIPTLCHDDKLDPYGGRRLCVVHAEGAPPPPAA